MARQSPSTLRHGLAPDREAELKLVLAACILVFAGLCIAWLG